MPTTPPASRVLVAAVTGAATTAYYATPDLIRSRAARGWTKAGIAVVLTAAALPDLRRARASAAAERVRRRQEARRAPDAPEGPEDDRELVDVLREMNPRARVTTAAVAASLVAGSVAVTVAGERWVFRRGEARRAAGRPWAHSRAAVVWGLVATGLALLPDPSETGDPVEG